MNKLNILLSAIALMAGGSAMAGTLSPAAGDLPLGNDTVQASTLDRSTLDRSTVAAQAAAQLPAAGQMSAVSLHQGSEPGLSRAQVRAEMQDFMPAAGES